MKTIIIIVIVFKLSTVFIGFFDLIINHLKLITYDKQNKIKAISVMIIAIDKIKIA